jgi:putative phosphoesterase
VISIGLLSDTHGHFDSGWKEVFKSCDEIWHAGDIGHQNVTEELDKICPVRAVYGNIDGQDIRIRYPEYLHFEIAGLRVLMIHIAGPLGKYNPRVREIISLYGKVDLLVCGHSHLLKVQMDQQFGWMYMNPGAAGVHGFHQKKTLLRFQIEKGRLSHLELIDWGPRGKI